MRLRRLRSALGVVPASVDNMTWVSGGAAPVLEVAGFCASTDAAPAALQLRIDGHIVGRVRCVDPRPDVAEALGKDRSTPFGFRVWARVPADLATQRRQLTLHSERGRGRKLATAPIPELRDDLGEGDVTGSLDHPDQAAVLTSPVLAVSGWVLAPAGTARVEVDVEGLGCRPALLGLPRPDVSEGALLPDASGCGFSSVIDLTGVESGPCSLVVRAVDGRGRAHVIAARDITVSVPPLTHTGSTRSESAVQPARRGYGTSLLIVLPDGRYGGAQLRALDLVPRLLPRFQVTVTSPQNGPLLPSFRDAGARVEVLPGPLDIGLRDLISRAQVDVMLAETLLCDWAVRVASEEGVATIFEIHESLPLPEQLYAFRGRDDGLAEAVLAAVSAVRQASAVVVPQDELASQIGQASGRRAVVVPTGIDVASWRLQLARVNARRSGASAGRLAVLCVGTGAPHKGQAVLLRALMLMPDSVGTVTFLGAGESSYVEALRHDSWASGLGHVVFQPVTDEPAPHYVAADVLVCPSYTETFSGVVLEARVAGLPVIAADIPGIRAAAGAYPVVWVPPGDSAALAEALARLAAQGVPPPTSAEDVPTADARAERITSLIQELVG